MAPGASSTNSGIREFYAPLTTAETSQQSMPASSINHDIREFYAPRTTEPLTSRQQSMPRVEHQTSQRPIKPHTLHNSTNRTRPDDDHQVEAGCLGEIKNYKAGDEFVLLWKWVDDFMDKRRAKKNSSKSHNVNKSTTSQLKPTPSSSRAAHQVPRPVVTPSPEAVRRQAIDREDMREYKTQRHTPWGELSHLYQSWRDQQAKKKADRAKQRKAEEIARGQAPNRKADAPRGRSINQREPPQNTPSPPGQHPQPGAAGKPNPAYNKKRGEVQKHTVKIAQLPPVHNSVHLQHTPSNNYRTRPSPDRGQKDRPTRDTRFSDFLHHRHAPPSQKPAPSRDTQWTYAVPGQDDELVRNSRFSSVLDPAKDFKKAKEAEKAKGPTCYICGCSDCAGGYRDIISRLWVCAACQKNEGIEPVQCAVCGEPSSPDSGYAGNGLWMCSSCRDPTTPKELPPSPKLAREDRSKGESEESEHCECDNPCPPIVILDDKRLSICPNCDKRLTLSQSFVACRRLMLPCLATAYPSRSTIVTISTPTTDGSHKPPRPCHRSQSDSASYSMTRKKRSRRRHSGPHPH